jgi:hypothetical protein
MDATLATTPAALRPSPLLRGALRADALASGAGGLLMLAGGPALAAPLGLPTGLLQGAGLLCLGWAAVTFLMSRRGTLPAWAVWAVIGLNLAWVVESVVLLLSGWIAPTGLGVAFVLALAAVVDGLALAQWIGLRRSR